ncbi:hypothetical protein K469DRAFT_566702, partial [Zopfia rhizophila CBS 207.26]
VILFTNTITKLEELIKREYKRPSKISTNTKYIRLVFRNLTVKVLTILIFINLYNYFMKGVD